MQLLAGRHAHAFVAQLDVHAEPCKRRQDRDEIVGLHAVDGQVAAGDRSEADEACDLDVVRADRPFAATEAVDALDLEDVRLDSLDRRSERDEKTAEVLHVWLARRVADHGAPRSERCRHQDVLGRHHARLVEEDIRAAQAVRPHLVEVAGLDVRAEVREPVDVRVEPSAPDDIAAGRRARRRLHSGRGAGRPAGTRLACESRAPGRALSCGSRRPGRGPRSRPVHSTSAPTSTRSASIVSTSRIRGTFRSATGSLVSRQAARIGSTPFLFPAARTCPCRGCPPSMTKDSISSCPTIVSAIGDGLSYPSLGDHSRARLGDPDPLYEERGAAPPRPRRRGLRSGLCPQVRRGRGALGRHCAPARLRLGDASDARPAPAGRRADPARGGLPRGGRSRASSPTRSTSAPTRHAAEEDALRLRRALGFIHACGLVRPDGIATLEPKSVKKKLKQPRSRPA